MNTPRTEIVSVHKVRLFARARERNLTRQLPTIYYPDGQRLHVTAMIRLRDAGETFLVPAWTRGFRVRKAGRFQFVVEATDWVGH